MSLNLTNQHATDLWQVNPLLSSEQADAVAERIVQERARIDLQYLNEYVKLLVRKGKLTI